MGRLVISLGSLSLLAFHPREGTTRLGRATDNDIVLALPEVAEHHAELVVSAGGAAMRALGEEAILVNGRAVSESPLGPEDRVLLGGYRLRWFLDDREYEDEAREDRVPTAGFESTGPLVATGSGSAAPVARIVVVTGPDTGMEADLEDRVSLVGRSPECDLVLQDETVSWRHFSLERLPKGVRVRDLGSRNGTILDGQRVESAVASVGAGIRLGRTKLRLAESPSAEESGAEGLPSGTTLSGLAELVGRSEAMQEVYARIREASSSRVPVLVLGETGTGKELAARALHSLGPRSSGPFVPVNCAAIPRDLIEDELFGHVRGAFTGATGDRPGAFEAARGGTIFLDEIAEMPLDLQPKLLRALDEGELPRVGGAAIAGDFRVVAATNRDLAKEVTAGRFRRDLYFRLAVLSIRLPPLRDRPEDLPDLAHEFLSSAERRTGVRDTSRTQFSEAAFRPLREHSWPGNVRELRNLILQAVMRVPGGVIRSRLVEKLLSEHPLAEAGAPCGSGSLEQMERDAIQNALRDCNGQRRAAARRLGIAESTLYEKIRRYGLVP